MQLTAGLDGTLSSISSSKFRNSRNFHQNYQICETCWLKISCRRFACCRPRDLKDSRRRGKGREEPRISLYTSSEFRKLGMFVRSSNLIRLLETYFWQKPLYMPDIRADTLHDNTCVRCETSRVQIALKIEISRACAYICTRWVNRNRREEQSANVFP